MPRGFPYSTVKGSVRFLLDLLHLVTLEGILLFLA